MLNWLLKICSHSIKPMKEMVAVVYHREGSFVVICCVNQNMITCGEDGVEMRSVGLLGWGDLLLY